MENTQSGNDIATYEQVVQAYTLLLQENQQLKSELNSTRNDRMLERMHSLVLIITTFNSYTATDKKLKKIVENAKWHLNEILEKPKKLK